MSPLLQIDNLTKQFGGLVAVHDVSLQLEAGEILGLIGPNGAGKTTLFNVVSGSFPPSAGQVRFKGRNLIGLRPHRICAMGIARTFQIVKPFAKLTVVDNIKVGAFLRHRNSLEADRKAQELVEFVGLAASADQAAQELTTAGRKRLELARALSTEPTLLLLDEVMAGLTPTESLKVVDLINQVRQSGVTILMIEHVMKAIMTLSDRVAVLHHGELIAVGKPQEIANDPGVIEAYLGEEYQIAEG